MSAEKVKTPTILVSRTFRLPDGRTGRHTKYSALDPEHLVESTPISDEENVFFSTVSHEGMAINYSWHEDGEGRQFLLKLSGGGKDLREEIIGKFDAAIMRVCLEDFGIAIGEPKMKEDRHNWHITWSGS